MIGHTGGDHRPAAKLVRIERRGQPTDWDRVSPHAHPMVKAMCLIAKAEGVEQKKLADRSGVGVPIIRRWRLALTKPDIILLSAVLEALGYRLRLERLP